MTEAEALELGREAVGCPGWRWVPGMLAYFPRDGRRVRAENGNLWSSLAAVPDFRDPATAGCLLALVRGAWGDPAAYCFRAGGNEEIGVWHVSIDLGTHRVARRGPTEPAALVSALRAAPVAERSRPPKTPTAPDGA